MSLNQQNHGKMSLNEFFTLANTYIDEKLSTRTLSLLRLLNSNHIYDLVSQWAKTDFPDSELAEQLRVIKKAKRLLLKCLSTEMYPDGLNLLQVAQVQCKSLLESSRDNHNWTFSTLYCGGVEFIPTIDPSSFIKSLNKALYPMVIGHIYTTTHVELSVVVVRIQIFEQKYGSTESHPFSPLKPIYLAFPNSSPHVLHTWGDDVYITAVFHTLAEILSKPGKPVTYKKSDSLPTKDLATFATLKGISRHSSASGPWSIYADNLVDASPLRMFQATNKKQRRLSATDDVTEKRIRLANTRFTGRADGGPNKQQRENGKEYTSRLPISMAEFKITEPFDEDLTHPSITIRLEGKDVFAGVYQLAVDHSSDIENLPEYLTGEDGVTSGIVRNRSILRETF